MGPNILNGEALVEKIGSVNIVFPFNRTSKVECPIHVTLGCSELNCKSGFRQRKTFFFKRIHSSQYKFLEEREKIKETLEFWLPLELWKDDETVSNCFELGYPLSLET